MKQFFKTFAAVVAGIFVVGMIQTTIMSVVMLSMIGALSKSPTYSPKENTILKIDLHGQEREYAEPTPLAFLSGKKRQEISLHKQLQAICIAKIDPRISGIYLNAKNWQTGIASAQTLRKALADFKESGKFIVAYADQYSQSTYYVCSIADKIIINPSGTIDLHGLSATCGFYLGLMQKLGINMQIFKVGDYKSAVEPFSRKNMSAENKEQTQLYLNELWNSLINDISESRQINPQYLNKAIDGILAFGEAASYLQNGLADTLLYRSETESYLKELTFITAKEKLKFASIDEVCSIEQISSNKKADKIAILYAEGEISDVSKEFSPYDSEPYITSGILKEIQTLKNDEQVKAVVLRVNSPGGSAFLAEQIWKELSDLKAKKTLIVSMSDLAASGGYYISSCANLIVAEPTTITGSIGIFGIIPDFSGLIGKTDITIDNVKTNTYADFPSVTKPMDENEKCAIQAYVEKGYQLFLKRCAEGRTTPVDSIAKVAGGRVWSGTSAMKSGLIDVLGDLSVAIEFAADYAEIGDYIIENYPKQKDFFTLLFEDPMKQLKYACSPLGAEEESILAFIYRMKNIEILQTRLPFEINTNL